MTYVCNLAFDFVEMFVCDLVASVDLVKAIYDAAFGLMAMSVYAEALAQPVTYWAMS